MEIIIRIFKTSGRAMSVKEISKELLKEKMVSPNTILLNLQKFKSIFQRTEKGVYQLAPKLAKLSNDELRDHGRAHDMPESSKK